MMDAGIFAGLKALSPNAKVMPSGNEIRILIPKEDILAQITNSIPDNIKPSIKVEYGADGIVITARLI